MESSTQLGASTSSDCCIVRRSSRAIKHPRCYSPPKEDLCHLSPRRKKAKGRKKEKIEDFPTHDIAPDGSPFCCDYCHSSFIIDPIKRKKIGKKKIYPRQRFDPTTGRYLMLCNACGLNRIRLCKNPPKPVKDPLLIKHEKDLYLEEAKAFGDSLVTNLGDPNAERLYCPRFTSKGCRCIQTYLICGGRSDNYRKRAASLLKLIKMALKLSSKKCYNLSYVCGPKMGKKRGKVGMGNGHKKSKDYEEFVMTNRQLLKDEFNLCEMAIKRILCYSNNFLFKKLKSEQRECRVELVKGRKSKDWSLVNIADLMKEKCCQERCVLVAYTHSSLLQEWRNRASQGQQEARRVIAEMLTPSGLKSNCYKFVHMVTGSSMSVICSVSVYMRNTGGLRDPPPHGLKAFWESNAKRQGADELSEQTKNESGTSGKTLKRQTVTKVVSSQQQALTTIRAQGQETVTAVRLTPDSIVPNVVISQMPGLSSANPVQTGSETMNLCESVRDSIDGIGSNAKTETMELVTFVDADGNTQLIQVPIINCTAMDTDNFEQSMNVQIDTGNVSLMDNFAIHQATNSNSISRETPSGSADINYINREIIERAHVQDQENQTQNDKNFVSKSDSIVGINLEMASYGDVVNNFNFITAPIGNMDIPVTSQSQGLADGTGNELVYHGIPGMPVLLDSFNIGSSYVGSSDLNLSQKNAKINFKQTGDESPSKSISELVTTTGMPLTATVGPVKKVATTEHILPMGVDSRLMTVTPDITTTTAASVMEVSVAMSVKAMASTTTETANTSTVVSTSGMRLMDMLKTSTSDCSNMTTDDQNHQVSDMTNIMNMAGSVKNSSVLSSGKLERQETKQKLSEKNNETVGKADVTPDCVKANQILLSDFASVGTLSNLSKLQCLNSISKNVNVPKSKETGNDIRNEVAMTMCNLQRSHKAEGTLKSSDKSLVTELSDGPTKDAAKGIKPSFCHSIVQPKASLKKHSIIQSVLSTNAPPTLQQVSPAQYTLIQPMQSMIPTSMLLPSMVATNISNPGILRTELAKSQTADKKSVFILPKSMPDINKKIEKVSPTTPNMPVGFNIPLLSLPNAGFPMQLNVGDKRFNQTVIPCLVPTSDQTKLSTATVIQPQTHPSLAVPNVVTTKLSIPQPFGNKLMTLNAIGQLVPQNNKGVVISQELGKPQYASKSNTIILQHPKLHQKSGNVVTNMGSFNLQHEIPGGIRIPNFQQLGMRLPSHPQQLQKLPVGSVPVSSTQISNSFGLGTSSAKHHLKELLPVLSDTVKATKP